MNLQTTVIFICFAVVMMVAPSSSENLETENDYNMVIGEDVKRQVDKNVGPLIRFGKRGMLQIKLNEENDDSVADVMKKGASNRRDMIRCFERALAKAAGGQGGVDTMLRFG